MNTNPHLVRGVLATDMDARLPIHPPVFNQLAALRALREAIDQHVRYPAVVGVLGKRGAGKSSLCNALLGEEIAEVSEVHAGTLSPQELTVVYRQGKGLSLIDMPGIGAAEDTQYLEAPFYRDLLPECDLLLWLIKSDDRALGIDAQVYTELVRPFAEQAGVPVLCVISQADKIAPCQEWDWDLQQPGPAQWQNLQDKVSQLRRQFDLAALPICPVSVNSPYGLLQLLEVILRSLPHQRRTQYPRDWSDRPAPET